MHSNEKFFAYNGIRRGYYRFYYHILKKIVLSESSALQSKPKYYLNTFEYSTEYSKTRLTDRVIRCT